MLVLPVHLYNVNGSTMVPQIDATQSQVLCPFSLAGIVFSLVHSYTLHMTITCPTSLLDMDSQPA